MQSETKDYAAFEVMQERRREGERGNEKGKDGEGGVWGLSCGKICY